MESLLEESWGVAYPDGPREQSRTCLVIHLPLQFSKAASSSFLCHGFSLLLPLLSRLYDQCVHITDSIPSPSMVLAVHPPLLFWPSAVPNNLRPWRTSSRASSRFPFPSLTCCTEMVKEDYAPTLSWQRWVWSPRAAVTNCQQLHGLKQLQFILSQFLGQKVQNQGVDWAMLPLEAPEKSLLPVPAPGSSPWLVAASPGSLPLSSQGLLLCASPWSVSRKDTCQGVRACLDNPGWARLSILSSAASTKTLFPNQVTFTGSRD